MTTATLTPQEKQTLRTAAYGAVTLVSVAYPGPIYRFSSFGQVARTAAPKLGEHTQDVLRRAASKNPEEVAP